METIESCIRAQISSSSHPDPTLCICRGRGWVLSDYDTWHSCPSHQNRIHPESVEYGGRYPTLRVVDRRNKPVTVGGDISEATYECDAKGLDTAKRDARRLTDKLSRYGWRVILRWKTLPAYH